MDSLVSLLDRNRMVVITLASMLLAILVGMISTTANLIVISVAGALLGGVFLLNRLAWIIWLVLLLGLLVVGPAPLYNPTFDPKAGWPIQILCFYLMLVALFNVATTPKSRQETPLFVWLMLVFFMYGVLNSIAHWHSALEFFGGIKRYFQMWGLLFALCWLGFDERRVQRWQTFFIIVALAQLPFAVYELIAWVPLREAMRNSLPGMVPIDIVAGTFGSTIYGGGASGEMSTFLVIVVAFLLARRMQKTISTGRFVWLTLWVLAPLFVGETKAVIIMLPLMFLAIFRRELLARPHYGVMALIVGTLLTVSMGYAYLNITQMSLDKLFADTLSYNLYEKGYGVNYLNRTTVLTFWANHQGAQDPVSFVFGNGLGSAHEKTGGHVGVRYPGYGIGLTAASTLLWDTGMFGCILIVAIFTLAWQAAGRLYRESTRPMVKADATAIQASLLLFAFHIFYRLDLLETVSIQIVFASVLGYLSWLYRRHATSMVESLS